LKDGTCVTGSKPFCERYLLGSDNVCEFCQDGYYLSQGNCLKHSDVSKCTAYHPITPNICTKCSGENLPFEVLNFCKATTAIPGCDIFLNSTQC
jgi:hypothetical protein